MQSPTLNTAPRLLSVLLLAAVFPLCAQTPPAPTLPDWAELSHEQREQLTAPTRDRWNSATPEQRTRMLARAERWQQMEPGQRARISGTIDRWQHLPPMRHQELRALFHHLNTLPETERSEFMRRWLTMTPEQRQEWIQANPAPTRRRPEHQRSGEDTPKAPEAA